MDKVQHIALGKPLSSSDAQSVKKIPEWKKSRWYVTEEYDRLIIKAVDKGYEHYNHLPEDLKFNLTLEIVKAEKNSAFVDYDQDFKLEEYLIEILLNHGSKESVDDLSDYLLNDFMSNEHFIRNINFSIEDQINTKKGGMKHA